MNRTETKNWAKTKIKGHIWELLVPIIVATVLTSLTIGQHFSTEGGSFQVSGGVNLGIFFYFVTVGLAYFMVKFINDQPHEFKDLFYFSKDYVRIFLINLLQTIFIFLWTLLLIVPGIIKAFAYVMVPLILADDKYKDLGYRDVIRKSQDIMSGHKADYFVLCLSFIGWHILAIFTFGLLEIWIAPYYTTAKYKFLNDIKVDYESKNGMTNSETPVPQASSEETKYCPNCGSPVTEENQFCSNCGQQI